MKITVTVLMMEAVRNFETSVNFCDTGRRNILQVFLKQLCGLGAETRGRTRIMTAILCIHLHVLVAQDT